MTARELRRKGGGRQARKRARTARTKISQRILALARGRK